MDIGLLLDLGAALAGNRTAVGRGAEAISFDHLEHLVAAGARRFRDSSARSIAFVCPSGPAFHVALFAAARAGVPITPLDPGLPAATVRNFVRRMPAPLLITDRSTRAGAAAAEVTSTPALPSAALLAGPGD